MSFSHSLFSWCGCLALLFAAFDVSTAQSSEQVLYSFKGGSDGAHPYAGVISDGAGNFYGTTYEGGGCSQHQGCGTVFKLGPNGAETILHSFANNCDGAQPTGSVVLDQSGNFYGTTYSGGCQGYGTAYEIASDGTESVLYAFQGGTDGLEPDGLIEDQGNFYGVTGGGGAHDCGTVFELQPNGQITTLYAFQGGKDGCRPQGALITDSAGDFLGTTEYAGGTGGCTHGCGTIFKLAPDGSETVLYAFQGSNDGAYPEAGVIADSAGDLYGTTTEGGGTNDGGTVFKLASDGIESIVYAFGGYESGDGWYPAAGLITDNTGNLYGTTVYGGTDCIGQCPDGGGIVFKIASNGNEKVLWRFAHQKKGYHPLAGLLAGANGVFYGAAEKGGAHKDGVVFELKP